MSVVPGQDSQWRSTYHVWADRPTPYKHVSEQKRRLNRELCISISRMGGDKTVCRDRVFS